MHEYKFNGKRQTIYTEHRTEPKAVADLLWLLFVLCVVLFFNCIRIQPPNEWTVDQTKPQCVHKTRRMCKRRNHLLSFSAHVSLANTKLEVDVTWPANKTQTHSYSTNRMRVVNKRKCANVIAAERNEYELLGRERESERGRLSGSLTRPYTKHVNRAKRARATS